MCGTSHAMLGVDRRWRGVGCARHRGRRRRRRARPARCVHRTRVDAWSPRGCRCRHRIRTPSHRGGRSRGSRGRRVRAAPLGRVAIARSTTWRGRRAREQRGGSGRIRSRVASESLRQCGRLGVDRSEQPCAGFRVEFGAQPVHAGFGVDALGERSCVALPGGSFEPSIGGELVDDTFDVSAELAGRRRCRCGREFRRRATAAPISPSSSRRWTACARASACSVPIRPLPSWPTPRAVTPLPRLVGRSVRPGVSSRCRARPISSPAGTPDPAAASAFARRARACSVSVTKPLTTVELAECSDHSARVEGVDVHRLQPLDQRAHDHGIIMTGGCNRVAGTRNEWGSGWIELRLHMHTGCGAAWLARLSGGQEVGSSNLPSPTQ